MVDDKIHKEFKTEQYLSKVFSPLLSLDSIPFSAPHLPPCKERGNHMQVLIQNNQVSVVAKVQAPFAVVDTDSGGGVQRGSLQCLCYGATCTSNKASVTAQHVQFTSLVRE